MPSYYMLEIPAQNEIVQKLIEQMQIIRLYLTVKPAYNDHSWDPKFVAVVDRWSLFRGSLMF